ncbi:uncharacterized protein LOC130624974 [Hydractinia symbiolongicarpus]|uniref:uncharacterized protein LOC130624974 n=1 Tax=Hydractinia symbiolongicarpus TaxID=13093 RepID=UPI00254A22B6|nr:uncharacterized protein LOC130624974 [Hydractinia symbiolongicarpus]
MAEGNVTTTPLSSPEKTKVLNLDKYILCIFDMETTTLFPNCELIQISAISYGRSTSPFNVYILPNGNIPQTHVTGISKRRGKLYDKNSIEISSVRVEEGLKRFVEWIAFFGKKIVLIAHNAKQFDVKHIMLTMKEHNQLENFEKVVAGFVDTLPLFKARSRESCSLNNLYEKHVGNTFDHHNSLADCQALKKILLNASVDTTELENHSFTFKYAREYYEFLLDINLIKSTYTNCLRAGAITTYMVEKVALAGIRYGDMVAIYQREGGEGLKKLLTGGVENIPFVTKDKKVIQKLANHL